MPHKTLVINGHGAKRKEKFAINQGYSIVTPGNAADNYLLSFDDMERHLEEMTYQNKLWPISHQGTLVDWQHHNDTSLHDIDISPLKHHFTFKRFAADILADKTTWGKLTNPEHNVLARGSLAVQRPDSSVVILENQDLISYLEQEKQGTANGTPLFFCDKELGKIKPLGRATLSKIYTAVSLIDEFKEHGAAIIVATCSPDQAHAKTIMVQTKLSPIELSSVITPSKKPQPLVAPPSVPVGTKKAVSVEQMVNKAAVLLGLLNVTGVKIVPRVEHFIPGNDEHNKMQTLESIQFEFQSEKQRDDFKQFLINMPGIEQGLVYEGLGLSEQPIIQLSPDFILNYLEQKVPRSLTELLTDVEQNVGLFSTYRTTIGAGETIPFTAKPAQQFLSGLGVTNNVNALLSAKASGTVAAEGNGSVKMKSLGGSDELVITGKRIDRLVKSAKTYVNTDIFPKGQYATAMTNGTIHPQDKGISSASKLHWQNMAVGLCHVQEIDLLVEQSINRNGEAICAPRKALIDEQAPALLLLSTPALNFAYGVAGNLNKTQREAFIAGMFRNLFNATVSEGRQYIAMPAAGLGVFTGDPKLYFAKLMEIAKEFPDLHIIYHPAANGAVFDQQLALNNPGNVVRAHKDVLFLANELTQRGHPCAFHNPSDSDVVYGVYDVGEYWKTGTGAAYVGEEHIGAMTTAPLNSRGLNPNAYQNIVEHAFVKTAAVENTAIVDDVVKATAATTPLDASLPIPQEKAPGKTNIDEQQYLLLITDKLLPLTKNYMEHLNDVAKGLQEPEKALVQVKEKIVNKLLYCLQNKQKNSNPSERVKSFYKLLDTSETEIKAHRDPEWKRYVQNALICAGILISGILPGLIALAIYSHTGNTAGKSFLFWRSQGENVVSGLKGHKPEGTDEPNAEEASSLKPE